jgi:hypothetical protein
LGPGLRRGDACAGATRPPGHCPLSLRKYDTWTFESRRSRALRLHGVADLAYTGIGFNQTFKRCSCHDQNADDLRHRDCDRGARVRRRVSFRRAFPRLLLGDAAAATLARAFPPGSAGIGIRGFPAFRFSPVAIDRRPRF